MLTGAGLRICRRPEGRPGAPRQRHGGPPDDQGMDAAGQGRLQERGAVGATRRRRGPGGGPGGGRLGHPACGRVAADLEPARLAVAAWRPRSWRWPAWRGWGPCQLPAAVARAGPVLGEQSDAASATSATLTAAQAEASSSTSSGSGVNGLDERRCGHGPSASQAPPQVGDEVFTTRASSWRSGPSSARPPYLFRRWPGAGYCGRRPRWKTMTWSSVGHERKRRRRRRPAGHETSVTLLSR